MYYVNFEDIEIRCEICDVLHDLVPFVQFEKCEKPPWRSVDFTLLKSALLHGCFSRFLNCTNGTKSRNAPHISHKKDMMTNI